MFYLAVVLVLVGSNLRRPRTEEVEGGRGCVVEYRDDAGTTTRILDAAVQEEEEGCLADCV